MRAGIVDVADGNWSSFVASQHHRVAKVFSLTEHVRSPGVLLFSLRVWETLTSEDKAIIRTAAQDSVAYYRRLWDDHEAAARRTAEAAGVLTVSDVDYKGFAATLPVPLHATAVSDARPKSIIEASTPTKARSQSPICRQAAPDRDLLERRRWSLSC